MCSQPGANKPLKPKSKGEIKWKKPIYCLQAVVYSCSPMSLATWLPRPHPTYLVPACVHSLPPCSHLLIQRCTKARRQILEILKFYLHHLFHIILPDVPLDYSQVQMMLTILGTPTLPSFLFSPSHWWNRCVCPQTQRFPLGLVWLIIIAPHCSYYCHMVSLLEQVLLPLAEVSIHPAVPPMTVWTRPI